MPRLTLRGWLLVTHLLVLGMPVLLLLFTGYMRGELHRQAGAELASRAPLVARVIGREVTGPLEAPGAALERRAADFVSTLGPLPDEPYPAHLWLYGLQGRLLASSAGDVPPPTDAGVDAALDGRMDARVVQPPDPGLAQRIAGRFVAMGRVVVSVPVRVEGRVVGVVVMARPPPGLGTLTFGGLPALSVLAFLALWITALLSMVVADRIGAALGDVADAAGRIADGDLRAAHALADPVAPVREIDDLTEDVRRMARRIEERLQFVQELASNVAHEFRTPLATLVGTVELLEDEEMPVEDRRAFLDRASEQLVRLQDLIDGLLALARADRVDDRVPVDLQLLACDVAGDDPDVEVRGTAGRVVADEALLHAVVSNLVGNAHQHGGVPIEVVGWTDDEATGLDVVDHGPGIPAEVLPRVFDRFYTTDRAHGTGLGLALVRAVVESHGGTVDVASAPGRTRFRVALPRLA